MEDDDEMQTLPTPPANAAISYGEAIAASQEAKAAGVARGNIQVLDESAETLQMPQVSALQATLSAAAASQVTAAVLSGEVAYLPTKSWLLRQQESLQATALQEEALRDFEQRRRMKTTLVPTSVEAVKQVLRSIGEPVTLFGEQPVCPPSSLACCPAAVLDL